MIVDLDSIGPFAAEALKVFRPRSTETIWAWAESHVYLDDKMSPGRPGFYSSSLTPYTRDLQEFPLDTEWDEYIVEKSSRTGFTEATLNIIRWMPEHNPGPALYVIDTQEEVRGISQTRLKPTIKLCAGEVMPDDDDKMGTMKIQLDTMDIILSGGGSTAVFRNKSVLLGILDEVENHKININPGPEGTSVHLMRSRFTTVAAGKMIVLGKPKLRGGIINSEVETGSLHKVFVPCPHCERMQVLEDASGEDVGRQFPNQLKFGHLKDLAGDYDLSRFEKEVYWECLYCEGAIYWHDHLPGMLAKHELRRTHVTEAELMEIPDDERLWYKVGRRYPRRKSLRISDLYSPFPRVCWGRLAEMFVMALKSDNRGDLQHLYTNHLTIAWEPESIEVRHDALLKLRSGLVSKGVTVGPRYFIDVEREKRVCPIVPVMLTAAIDRQGDCDKYTIGAIDETLSWWLVCFGEIIGEKAIFDLFAREFPVLGGKSFWHPIYGPDTTHVSVISGLIDSGDQTFETYDLCLDAQAEDIPLYPSMGTTVSDGIIARRQKEYGAGKKIERYDYSDKPLKKQLYRDRFDPARASRVWFPTDIQRFPKFLAELQGEKLIKAQNKMGHALEDWKKVGTNDYGDTLKMHQVIIMNCKDQIADIIKEMQAHRKSNAPAA